MKSIKVFTLAVLAVCMTFTLAACGSGDKAGTPVNSDQTKEKSEAVIQESSAETQKEGEVSDIMVGGWALTDTGISSVPEDAQKALDNAMEGYTGMKLEARAVLATQVVSGTNYAYLCIGQRVVKNPVPGWYVVVVYEDLQGEAKITGIEEIEIPDIETEDDIQETLLGGWNIADAPKAALEDALQASFEEAAGKNLGVDLVPVAQLASQLVSGNNYLIICRGTTVTKEPAASLYAVTLYVPLSGEAKFTDVKIFDLEEYIDD